MTQEELSDYDKIWNIIDNNENFHVVLDNDMFYIYPGSAPDDEVSDEDYDRWHDSGVRIDQPPERILLEVLIDFLGGTSEHV